jgi:serine/threonine-protein kinase
VPRRREALIAVESLPSRIGRYDLGEKIADGGMAHVYLARLPLGGNRFVALKVLREDLAEDPQYVAMFRDEAKLLSRLAHESTVQLYEAGEDQGLHYIAMELLIGESLLSVWEAFKERDARIPYSVAAWIGARVADGLHHAHELVDEAGTPENVVHRDVNPSNVFLTFDGRTKVIDFGLARSETRLSVTATGVVKGKLAYLSPEQVDGQAPDRRADLFALGTTLWEITVDRRLFKQDGDIATVRAIHACNVPDPRSIRDDFPASLWTVLRRALARDPRERYATGAELARDLDACVTSMGPAVTNAKLAQMMAQVATWSATPPPPSSRRT